LSRWGLGVLCATLAVVLFGAVVRITGSGAGCGQHWPTCHGEIVHLPRSVDTAIELTHRTTSGLSLLAVFALSLAAFRCFETGHRVRRAAFWASAMMIVEALLGAGLVLFELVGADRSAARAVMMPLHLISTSVLTGALALVAWWSHPRDPRAPAGDRAIWKLAGVGLGLVLLVSATGALTALGDTVYPVQPAALGERWATDQATGAHFLERLRVLHPIVAVAVGLFLIALARKALARLTSRAGLAFARAVIALVLLQIAVGSVNVLLSAPGYLQVVHLFFASLVWLALVLLAVEAREPRTAPPT
jgi:heme a synthase